MARQKTSPRQQRPAARSASCASANWSAMRVAEMLTRGDVHDPVLEGHLITVPEVRMSPDLRLATIYVMPLGGHDADEVRRGASSATRNSCAARSRTAST